MEQKEMKNHVRATKETSRNRFRNPLQACLKKVFSPLLYLFIWPIKYLSLFLVPHNLISLVMATVLLFMVYLPSGMLYSYLLNWISLPNLIGLMTTSLTSISAPVVYFYCATLHGPFCPPDGNVNLVQGQISQIARSVTGTARVASDVLDSVIQLSEPGHLALHQTEIIELPYAILWSSELPEKDQLSNDLNELSTLSGELRNKLYGLNRQGLNSFSSISHEVSFFSIICLFFKR
jgi:hypothetical protein